MTCFKFLPIASAISTLLYRIVLLFILVFKVQDVMDGDLDDFISAYLRTSVDGRKSKVDQNLDADD